MLTELLAEIRNYFEVPNGRHFGKFTISGGSIAPLDFLQDGQYFRIIGSVFNDGVHQYPVPNLTDEVFYGAVWAMAVPPTLSALAAEINDWNKKYGELVNSPYASESFGGYQYSKAFGAESSGGVVKWETVFRKQLNRYRKI